MPMKGTVKALVNETTKGQLNGLPNFTINKADTIGNYRDVSRPEGWGGSDSSNPIAKDLTYSGGIAYDVDQMISGNFEILQTKGEVYGKCVQAILSDVIRKIEHPDHQLRVNIEDALIALEIAILASE